MGKELLIMLGIIICDLGTSYLVIYAITDEPNLLIWGFATKVWFLIIVLLLFLHD